MATQRNQISPSDRERLTKLLGEELKLLKQIQKLTEKQTELLSGDDIDPFDDSLNKRQQLIEKINGLHQDSDSLMQSYVSTPLDEADNEIEVLRAQIKELLEICAKRNNENMDALKAKETEHTKKIDEQSKKRKGIGGYAQAVPNIPEMIDKKT